MVFLLQLACVGKFVKTNGFGNEAVDDRPAPQGLALEFENVKNFVQEGVGIAIVPGVTVKQELRDGTLVRVPLRELAMPRRTLMIYREDGYLSKPAAELIKLVRTFNWEAADAAQARAIGAPAQFAPRPRAKR